MEITKMTLKVCKQCMTRITELNVCNICSDFNVVCLEAYNKLISLVKKTELFDTWEVMPHVYSITIMSNNTKKISTFNVPSTDTICDARWYNASDVHSLKAWLGPAFQKTKISRIKPYYIDFKHF